MSVRKRAFIPSVDGHLEPRIAMATAFSAAVKASFTPPPTFGGGQVDKSIPFLNPFYGPNDPNAIEPYQGISIAFNFTSGTFYDLMVPGFKGVPGLLPSIKRFSANGNQAVFYQQLSLLAGHVPFGLKNDALLYEWALVLYQTGRLPAGARLNGPAPTSPPTQTGLTNAQVGQIIEQTLLGYLQDGIGQSFNIVKSQGSHPTDKLLTFNGVV